MKCKKGKVKRCRKVTVTRCSCSTRKSPAKAGKKRKSKSVRKALTEVQKIRRNKRLWASLTPAQHEKAAKLVRSRRLHAQDWDGKMQIIKEVKFLSKHKSGPRGLAQIEREHQMDEMSERGWVG